MVEKYILNLRKLNFLDSIDISGPAWYNKAILKKEVNQMPTDRKSNEIKKSMAYDLIDIIESNPEKDSYTSEEIKALIKAYITGMSQK